MEQKRKFIFDTDIGPDCDDCGALAIMDRYHKAGKIELLGITHCTSDLYCLDVIAAINGYFDVNVPIGQTERKGFLEEYTLYTKPVAMTYREKHSIPTSEPAIPLMRRLLAENRHVHMVFVGPLSNMHDLLLSGPDALSPLTGEELVKQSVDTVYVMGGHFGDFSITEWNIEMDIPAAQVMAEKCPVPIVYCGFEAGEHIITGDTLKDCGEEYPVRQAYLLHSSTGGRSSWDLVTTYYALEPDNPGWVLSEDSCIRFKDNGNVVLTEGTGGRYVRYGNAEEIKNILNGIITEKNDL